MIEILGLYSICCFAAYLYVIGCYQDWHGLASFGNRFFVSLTVLFILGLSSVFAWLARDWNSRRATIFVPTATAALILWNMGLIFQWGMHLIPARGPISWRDDGLQPSRSSPGVSNSLFKCLLPATEAIDGPH